MADDYEVEVGQLQAIVRRDQDAFGRWVTQHEIPLRLALRRFAELVDVEVIVQETAIVVWERAATIRPDGRRGFLWRWAVTVALNKARNEARRTARLAHDVTSTELENELADPDSARTQPDQMFIARLNRCRSQLPETLGRALDVRIEDNGQRSDRELATSIGVSFDAFRQSLARGRKALKQCLSSFGIDLTEYAR